MAALSLAVVNCGKGRNAEDLSSEFVPHLSLGSEFLTKRLYGLNLKDLGNPKVRTRKKFRIGAAIKKWKKHDYPWPGDIEPDTKTPLKYLSYFKPLDEKPKPVTLAFEKPLVNLEKQLIEVRRMAEDTGLDFTDQIYALEAKYQQALKDLYTHLTPIQRLQIARHPNRPTVLDHLLNMTEKWVELHGDRAGYDDPAMVTGIGSIEGRSYLFIGHQKGRNTKENIMRNFAMPTPHGYRKALRMMKYADHHGFPIVTFVDTPGAFADLRSEELGQGEAIAYNLRAMFGLKVPIITVVTGEGGSGGALAIGCANKLLMLENSAFYVASPEACAAILWKSSQAAPKAAEKLRITAQEHYRLRIADGIIPEPLGGAHADPFWASQQIKHAILNAMVELGRMNSEQLLHQRMLKFRSIGGFQEGIQVEPERKHNMKPSEANSPPADLESELANLRKKILEAKGPSDPVTIQVLEKLQEDLDSEMTKAFIAMGLENKIESLKLELQGAPIPDQPLNKSLQEKADKIMQEFKQKLSQPGAYLGLKQKLHTVNMAGRLIELKNKSEKIKAEVNQKIPTTVKDKIDRLKTASEKLRNGDSLDTNLAEEVEKAKKELEDVLRSANLEIVGMSKRTNVAAPPELEEEVAKVNEEIKDEIQRAVSRSGLSEKIEELKAEILKDSNSEKVKELETEIREGIAAALRVTPVKKKVESLREKLASLTKVDVESKVVAENGRW
ncbi:acetyl-coenzyme A carboxylase carboxyl transferase subunit alpha, chloroplastic-like isoform X2 [Solanum dulcamara]|uniref:acetyl-coenzyme A carboxylase carboxyl transferase subunit alpha, chloroplastic-like isoform X2 n=1 Tax=Solanum dulcamara TaxID=45834 RepID=UPI002484D974|nr:acetyl-coenzyme A carboxylase carboxyl transferase subunit alpha, chloroplastic-like isoform X2 [Solanum dulcamara]